MIALLVNDEEFFKETESAATVIPSPSPTFKVISEVKVPPSLNPPPAIT